MLQFGRLTSRQAVRILLFVSYVGAIFGMPGAGVADGLNGINLPPMQGTTNAGAFLPGVYQLEYTKEYLQDLKSAGFDLLRIPINAETAQDPASLEKIAGYLELFDHQGIICFFDTRHEGEGSHGDGRPNDLELVGRCWALIHAKFKRKKTIRYELFNEPFGYSKTPQGARDYLADMQTIAKVGRLPVNRCILDGLGYADNVRLVAQGGWRGELAYHFYPNWVPDGQRTQENYRDKILSDVGEFGSRVHITEFGAKLTEGDVYDTYTDDGSEASKHRNALCGFHDAVHEFRKAGRGIRSSCHWHGWNNGDTFDFMAQPSKYGARKIQEIQRSD